MEAEWFLSGLTVSLRGGDSHQKSTSSKRKIEGPTLYELETQAPLHETLHPTRPVDIMRRLSHTDHHREKRGVKENHVGQHLQSRILYWKKILCKRCRKGFNVGCGGT